MRNIIRADLYRVFRGIGTYVTLAVLITTIILQATTDGVIGIDIGGEVHSPEMAVLGRYAPLEQARNTDVMLFFLLPFIVFFAAADFSKGAAKNTLTGGVDRVKYYFAKLILIAGACVTLLLTHVFGTILAATLTYGFGGDFDAVFVGELARIYLPQLFLMIAFGCVGVFLTFSFRNAVVLNTVYIAFIIVPMVALSVIGMSLDRDLMIYDLVLNMKLFAMPTDFLQEHDPDLLLRCLLLGGAWILASTIGGILLFRKAEIK